MSANAFVGTMGVDIDLGGSLNRTVEIAQAVRRLGVRNVRLPILESDPPYERLVRKFFAIDPDVRTLAITNCSPPLGPYAHAAIDAADVAAFEATTGRHIAYLEAINEPNNQRDPNWAADTRRCIAPLTRENKLQLVAPALVLHAGGADEKALGNLLPSVAFANVHRYYSGRNPGTSGWGSADECGVYGALEWAMCWARVNAPGKPVIISETGWNSETELDEATQAKYISRVFFVDAIAGVVLTSIYGLVSYTGGDGFGGTGIMHTDFAPKPSYRAIENLTRLLADPGPGVRADDLAMTIDASSTSRGSDLQSCVLAKRGGVYDVVLWQETQSADPDNRGKDNPPQDLEVTLRFPAERHAIAYRWQDDGTAPSDVLGMARAFTVEVDDRLTILEIH